jgi:hypothetical protein
MNKPPYAELIAAAVQRPEFSQNGGLGCQTIPAFTVYYLPSTSASPVPALATLSRARTAVEKKTPPNLRTFTTNYKDARRGNLCVTCGTLPTERREVTYQ